MPVKVEDNRKPEGPYTVWVDYGYEGWSPTDFQTIKEALESDKYGSRWVITKPVDYEATDCEVRS